MKKRFFAWMTILVVLVSSFGMVLSSAAENVSTPRKFNVVFVVDASNSMNSTDSQGWRFEAIDQFLSLLSLKGNYVGTVVFNGEILHAEGVNSIESKSDKQKASDDVKSATPTGYTNIGEALVEANKLIANGNDDLPSIILLLSDGNTEMPSSADYQRSVNAQKDAISTAKNNNTQIYCVGLNANGRIDKAELENIATQTNGSFQIVSKADDLKDVFREFYKLIYGTGGIEIEVPLPAIEEFTVPKIGVEEVNILIDGMPTSIELIQPSGISVSNDELNSMTTKGEHFTNIKIEDPLGGLWKVKLDGDPNQTVTINFIPNLDVSLTTSHGTTESFKRGDSVSLVTKIVSEGAEVTDNSIYQEYPATLTITSANSSDYKKEIAATALDGMYKVEHAFEETGTYYVTASIDIGYGRIVGNTDVISVGNLIPQPVKSTFKITEYVMGMGNKQYSYDLNTMATDGDGEQLTFKVEKSQFDVEEYSIDGATLLVNPQSKTEGSFTVIATDPSGASCEFELIIAYKNLLLFLLVLIGSILIVGLVGFLIVKHILENKYYNGTITVVAFDEESGEVSTPMTDLPARGPKKIEMIAYDAKNIGGIEGTFFGSGKNFVTFKLRGLAYRGGRKVKKVLIKDGCTERITSRQDGTKGVDVTFTKNNY